MPKRVAITNLNATTLDIINTIRANASAAYRDTIPTVTKSEDLPAVGEILYGYPALANEFISALVNRIAQVRVNSATFNNAYANLKKGYLEFGETVNDIFVNIIKARTFSAEKAKDREFKRSIPDVKSVFYPMNYRVQYPVTIQNTDLKTAFLSFGGVEDLIAKIVGAVNVSAEYDEFLLFKYLIIKAVTRGKMFPVAIDSTDLSSAAKAFRGYSNKLTFMSDEYNNSRVMNVTPKDRQVIFMDALFNADFDVDVLSRAFNMDKADFMGRLYLIDDFTTFDNERFEIIRGESTMIEEVTADELALMRNVKALLLDSEWFQVYDELNQFSEAYVASGLYWNYFYNVWKTIAFSPYANAVVFVDNAADLNMPATITVEVVGKSVGENATVLTLLADIDPALHDARDVFVQTEEATEAGVAVHPYGAYMYPANADPVAGEIRIGDTVYTSAADAVVTTLSVGDTIEFTKS